MIAFMPARNPLALLLTAGAVMLASRAGAEVPLPPSAASFPKMFVGSPEFETKLGTRGAGTAFLGKFDDRPGVYLLTVRHLLGPAGGFPELVAPADVPAFVRAIRLRYLFTGGSKFLRVDSLKVPETADAKAPLFNVAVFKTSDASAIDAATLTTDEPKAGEPVWVLAHVRGGAPDTQLIHSAHVTEYRGRWLVCPFDNPEIVPNGASGAPVLNSAGKVVGVYCTHSNKDGAVVAYIIPSALIAEIVRAQP